MDTLPILWGGAFVGLGAVFAGYLWAKWRQPKPELPELGSHFRLRAISGIYRAKLVSYDRDGWRITSPLKRNQYVPLGPGDTLTVEAPITHGVYLFRTTVREVDEATNELILNPPTRLQPINRREDPRITTSKVVRMDGTPAQLVDVSTQGARIRTHLRYLRGDRARIDFGEAIYYAWVLDVWPTKFGDAFHEEVRIRFEEPFDLRAAN